LEIRKHAKKVHFIYLLNYNCFGDPGIAAVPEFKSICPCFSRTEINLVGRSIRGLGAGSAGDVFVSGNRSDEIIVMNVIVSVKSFAMRRIDRIRFNALDTENIHRVIHYFYAVYFNFIDGFNCLIIVVIITGSNGQS